MALAVIVVVPSESVTSAFTTVATAGIVSAVPTVPSAAVAPLAEERLPAVVLK